MQFIIKLNCDFFINLLRELVMHLNLRKGIVLKVIKPLYSVLEARNY
jgi:hypothetical protein